MTDQQLYFAIGVPVILNLLALLWQSRAVEKTLGARIDGVNTRIDSLEKVMNASFAGVDAKFDAVFARFDVFDAKFESARQALLRVEDVMFARLKHLEDKDK